MQNNNVALPVAVDAQDDESEGSSGLKVRTNLKAGAIADISIAAVSPYSSLSYSFLGGFVPRRGGGGTGV